jgi:hypothetical protein
VWSTEGRGDKGSAGPVIKSQSHPISKISRLKSTSVTLICDCSAVNAVRELGWEIKIKETAGFYKLRTMSFMSIPWYNYRTM